jgi:spore coat polysaccharide biosynthesis predicted glycosyltransferase SpsG
MLAMMLESGLAFSAGGQRLHEFAATGTTWTPAVAVQTVDNQTQSKAALAARGIVRVAGRAKNIDLMDKMKNLTFQTGFNKVLRSEHICLDRFCRIAFAARNYHQPTVLRVGSLGSTLPSRLP